MNPCVLIPTYNNERTVKQAVLDALAYAPVIVVNDGSTDATPHLLASIDGIVVETHAKNRGKGEALRTGFARALREGYTHAIVLDSDGQHVAAMIPRLIEPESNAIVIGARDLEAAGAGRGSRFGLVNSNFWTWLETGQRLPDTQSGMRRYPLAEIDDLYLWRRGYDFEIEVLVNAIWAGIPVVSVPVDVIYPDDRVSHMRPILDFLIIGHLNVRLLILRFGLPGPFLKIFVHRHFREKTFGAKIKEAFAELFLREPGPPRRVALSVGLGLFMGLSPIWGFQIATTLLVAHLTGLSKPTAVVASHISIPIFMPAILYTSLVLGRMALGVAPDERTTLELATSDLPAWIVGSFILATATALVGTVLTYCFLRCVRGLPSSR